MGSRGRVKKSSEVPLLRRLETVCLVLAAVAATAHLGGLLLVIGETVLPLWAVSGTLLAVSVVLHLMSRSEARDAGTPLPAPPFGLLRGIAAFVLGLICLGSAFSDLSAHYRVLNPSATNGCRAVVREHSFLFAGSGDVYAVGFGGIGFHASSWTTDDGYEPVADGSYALQWDGDTGVLNLTGSIDPVWPGIHTIRCS